MSTATDLLVYNECLVLCGASRITALTDAPNGPRITAIYASSRDFLLETYEWRFSITRTQVTENVTAPTFGRGHAYDLPADCLRILAPYPEDNFQDLDWMVEGSQIVTDDTSPLDLRYIQSVTDSDDWPVSFRKTMSAYLAVQVAESITQSNSKLRNISAIFEDTIAHAKRSQAIQRAAAPPAQDGWINVRRGGAINTKSWH